VRRRGGTGGAGLCRADRLHSRNNRFRSHRPSGCLRRDGSRYGMYAAGRLPGPGRGGVRCTVRSRHAWL
jgi:hypothetical protein